MRKQEPEEVVEVPGRVCDACRDHAASCRWPAHDRRKTCAKCSDKRIQCMIEKVAVSKRPLRRVGGSPSKKRWVGTPEELDSRVEVVRARKAPIGGMEKVLCSVVRAVEGWHRVRPQS